MIVGKSAPVDVLPQPGCLLRDLAFRFYQPSLLALLCQLLLLFTTGRRLHFILSSLKTMHTLNHNPPSKHVVWLCEINRTDSSTARSVYVSVLVHCCNKALHHSEKCSLIYSYKLPIHILLPIFLFFISRQHFSPSTVILMQRVKYYTCYSKMSIAIKLIPGWICMHLGFY